MLLQVPVHQDHRHHLQACPCRRLRRVNLEPALTQGHQWAIQDMTRALLTARINPGRTTTRLKTAMRRTTEDLPCLEATDLRHAEAAEMGLHRSEDVVEVHQEDREEVGRIEGEAALGAVVPPEVVAFEVESAFVKGKGSAKCL